LILEIYCWKIWIYWTNNSLKKNDKDNEIILCVRDNVQFLINKIWELQTERVTDVIVAKIPAPKCRLPREKPLPKARANTKWQQYAQLKGIQNRKKGKMAWDEQSKSWKPSWGYNRGNDPGKDWLIEIPHQKDPFTDFYGKKQEEKKERTAKNELQRVRNIARSNNLKVNGNLTPLAERSTQQLANLVSQSRKATASFGKFTSVLPNEKSPRDSGQKKQFKANEGELKSEKEKQLEILRRLSSKKSIVNVEKAVSHELTQEQNANARAKQSGEKKAKAKPKKQQKGSKRRSSMQTGNKARFSAKQRQKGRRR